MNDSITAWIVQPATRWVDNFSIVSFWLNSLYFIRFSFSMFYLYSCDFPLKSFVFLSWESVFPNNSTIDWFFYRKTSWNWRFQFLCSAKNGRGSVHSTSYTVQYECDGIKWNYPCACSLLYFVDFCVNNSIIETLMCNCYLRWAKVNSSKYRAQQQNSLRKIQNRLRMQFTGTSRLEKNIFSRYTHKRERKEL